MGKIRTIRQARPDRALDNLNRLTGLTFSSWPESLVSPSPPADPAKKDRPKGPAAGAKEGLGGLTPSSKTTQ